MRGTAGQVGRREQERIDGLKQRMKVLESATLCKQGFQVIEERA
jgi:hypothetical protein